MHQIDDHSGTAEQPVLSTKMNCFEFYVSRFYGTDGAVIMLKKEKEKRTYLCHDPLSKDIVEVKVVHYWQAGSRLDWTLLALVFSQVSSCTADWGRLTVKKRRDQSWTIDFTTLKTCFMKQWPRVFGILWMRRQQWINILTVCFCFKLHVHFGTCFRRWDLITIILLNIITCGMKGKIMFDYFVSLCFCSRCIIHFPQGQK